MLLKETPLQLADKDAHELPQIGLAWGGGGKKGVESQPKGTPGHGALGGGRATPSEWDSKAVTTACELSSPQSCTPAFREQASAWPRLGTSQADPGA